MKHTSIMTLFLDSSLLLTKALNPYHTSQSLDFYALLRLSCFSRV